MDLLVRNKKDIDYQFLVNIYQFLVKYLNVKYFLNNNMKPEDKIYRAYFESEKQKLYYNQLKELTGLSHSSLQNVLKKMSEKDLLGLEKTKAHKFYSIKDDKLFALKYSEIAVQKFKDLNPGVKVPLRHFLKDMPKNVYAVVLFGSASRKEEQKDSDIDLLVVSDKKLDLESNTREAETTSNYPITIFQADIHQFTRNEDDVIKQARKTGFPIHGEQNFYEAILDEH